MSDNPQRRWCGTFLIAVRPPPIRMSTVPFEISSWGSWSIYFVVKILAVPQLSLRTGEFLHICGYARKREMCAEPEQLDVDTEGVLEEEYGGTNNKFGAKRGVSNRQPGRLELHLS
jgi:hypothetical protein